MKCWNCLHENPKKKHRCVKCDQALQPNAAQRVAGSRNVDYLLAELKAWDFLDDEARSAIESVYLKRKDRLAEAGKSDIKWPETDWVDPPLPKAEPVSAQADEAPEESLEPEEEAEALAEAVAEADEQSEELTETSEDESSEESSEEAHEESSKESDSSEEATEEEPEESAEETKHDSVEEAENESLTENAPPEESLETPADIPLPVKELPDLTPAEPSILESVVGEADIRWFHTLGALLVVAAVVGWLRASWDDYGRLLTGILIAGSPIVLHGVAAKLKQSVPLSARLLAILANVLTPPALLALHVFGALPDWIPGAHYWTFSMVVSSFILLSQAQATKEKVPLYLGALCCVMGGWSQGGLTTASLSLALGFVFAKDWGDLDPDWLELRRKVSFYTGSFGALATLTLFDTGRHPMIPVVAFTGALLFTSLPTLTGQAQSTSRLFLQGLLSMLGSILMRTVLDVPAGGVALYLLFCAALFLAVKPESKAAQTSIKLASLIGFLGLGIGFFSGIGAVLTAKQTPDEAILRFVFAIVGAVFFLKAARKRPIENEAQPLVMAALLSTLGGWTHFILFLNPPAKVIDFLPLVGSMVVYEALLLLGSRRLQAREQKVVWSLTLPLLMFTGAMTFLGQILVKTGPGGWPLVLLAHSLLAFAWERGWLTKRPDQDSREYGAVLTTLPRLVLAGCGLFLYQSHPFPQSDQDLLLLLGCFFPLTYLLKGSYRSAAWEGSWLLLALSPVIFDSPLWLLLTATASFILSHAVASRKATSLALSAGLSAVILSMVSSHLTFFSLYIPAVAFAVAAILPARGEKEWGEVGQAKLGFPLLVCTALLLGNSPTEGGALNILYTLIVAALGGAAFVIEKSGKPKLVARLAHQVTGPAIMLTLMLWSLAQTPIETGVLFLLLGLVLGKFWEHQYKFEFASGFFIAGAAQISSPHHLLLELVIVCAGIIVVETIGMALKKKPLLNSHIILLVIAYLQQQTDILGHWADGIFLVAALLLAARGVQVNEKPVTIASTLLFLGEVDSTLTTADVDFKLRALPAAALLIAASLWKIRTEENWPKPALHLGLTLTVAPALLQFAGGINKFENFLWTLLLGAAFVALHFVTKEPLKMVLRQAGGYTLTAWATVSLTRAALSLPWQAATLVVGLALVGVGVVVEKRRRNAG